MGSFITPNWHSTGRVLRKETLPESEEIHKAFPFHLMSNMDMNSRVLRKCVLVLRLIGTRTISFSSKEVLQSSLTEMGSHVIPNSPLHPFELFEMKSVALSVFHNVIHNVIHNSDHNSDIFK